MVTNVRKVIFLGFIFMAGDIYGMKGPGQFDSEYKKENIVFYYKMDEGAGTTVKNSVGPAGIGTFEGSGNTWVSGQFGTAVDFVRSPGGGISIPDNDAFDVRDFTLMAWVNVRKGTSATSIIFAQVGGTNYAWGLTGSNNKVTCGANPDATDCTTTNPVIITSGVWTCVAYRRDALESGTARNGKCIFANEQTTCADTGNHSYALADDPEIGCNAGCANNNFDGQIDSIMMYNVALSDGEIKYQCEGRSGDAAVVGQ